MANHEYKILSEDSIKYLCGLIRDLASVSEGIDNINLADDKTFSNIYIKNLIDNCDCFFVIKSSIHISEFAKNLRVEFVLVKIVIRK